MSGGSAAEKGSFRAVRSSWLSRLCFGLAELAVGAREGLSKFLVLGPELGDSLVRQVQAAP
jgi:hypothetical protein